MRRLWWIPLVFSLVVGTVGGYAYRTLAEVTRHSVREQLQTILDADVAALQLWLAHQRATAKAAALEPMLRKVTAELIEIDRQTAESDLPRVLLGAAPVQLARDTVASVLEEHDYLAFGIVRRDGLILAAGTDGNLGRRIPIDFEQTERVWSGETSISRPMHEAAIGQPVDALRVAAPIESESGEILATLGFLVPASEFTRVLSIARAGESGETYAFDANGIMLSRSRFEEQLIEIGLITSHQKSTLNIEIRDPGVNLTLGETTSTPVRGRPLTRMAAAAIDSGAGSDIDGYNDYRGVTVVGVWTWLPELGIGVTSEIDYEEAYAGLVTVRRAFILLAMILFVTAVGMLIFSFLVARMGRTARKLGRYRIDEKIGEGGMGKVYRARHALLRRPTAVKVLDADKATEEGTKRFEREVQAVASLTHPNTIAVYDFGRIPDGSFYYAMEYLDGINIGELIEIGGAQPEGRVRHLLIQAAGSLAEAHSVGMVHRDLKPSNLMVSSRGGLFDFVKVLDFGLVRETREEELQLTRVESLTGTPLYLTPEALESPEKVGPHSDVYQLGAVAYYLLSGEHVFNGELVEVLSAHLHQVPEPPSAVRGEGEVSDLDRLVLACLEKDPGARPADARVLLEALEQVRVEPEWTQQDARTWWENSEDARANLHSDGPKTVGSMPSSWQVEPATRSGSL